MKTPSMRRFGLYACLFLCLPSAAATPLKAGDRLSGFTLADQHGELGRLDATTKLLLFSRDMKANKLAKAAFLPKPAQYLQDAKATYVIDVSAMPKFVTDHFAIPRMQEYAYRVLLDRGASATAALPSQKGRVTLIHLDQLTVTGIEYAATADALRRAVDAAAGPRDAVAHTP